MINLGIENLNPESDSLDFIKLALENDIAEKTNVDQFESISRQIASLTDQINFLSEVVEENRSMLRSVSRPKINLAGDFTNSDL